MDRLDVNLDDWELSPASGISIYPELWVNGEVLDYCLEVDVFIRAIRESGRYPLFTCGCGVFECGGNYIDTECTETECVMRNLYHPQSQALVKAFEYRFYWENVYEVAAKIREYVLRLSEEHPGENIGTGSVPLCNVVNLVREWETGVTLREDPSWSNDGIIKLIKKEAEKVGKVFRENCIEGHDYLWVERGLRLYDVSGWFLEPLEVEAFDRLIEDGDDEGLSVYYQRMLNFTWHMKKDGEVWIEIWPGYPEGPGM